MIGRVQLLISPISPKISLGVLENPTGSILIDSLALASCEASGRDNSIVLRLTQEADIGEVGNTHYSA